ncbi:hypothetical protein [Mesorhizobium sp.]|uniref:hypothetical protein n=1 Tax=Mesorhizobium sp. TaxID=1871066 RepID=UPI0026CDDAC9
MTNESVIGRRIFLGAAATLAAAPILASASSRASAHTGNASGSAAVPSSDRRKLGTLEVSSVGLGVQNMHRTYQTTIPSRPEMINIIRTAVEPARRRVSDGRDRRADAVREGRHPRDRVALLA